MSVSATTDLFIEFRENRIQFSRVVTYRLLQLSSLLGKKLTSARTAKTFVAWYVSLRMTLKIIDIIIVRQKFSLDDVDHNVPEGASNFF